jgi:predicted  nucleic acid-binding Zn-ribbon protein
MLYRQVASEKAALNRAKETIQEKLEKKRQKHSYLKQQLEETTRKFEKLRDENLSLG